MSPYLWMVGGAFAFAIMGTCAHALRAESPWQIIALIRSLIPLLATGALLAANGLPIFHWESKALWVRSLAGSLSLVATFFAFTRLPVADVLTLTNLFPLWLTLLSWPVLGEIPGKDAWACIVVGITGVVLMQQPHFVEGNLATLAALAASLCTAVAMMGLNRIPNLDSRSIVFHFSAVSFVFCLLCALFLRPDEVVVPVESWTNGLSLLGVGLSATVGQFCLTRAVTTGVPSKVSAVCLTQVAFALGFDFVLWDRRLGTQSLIGMLLVIAPTLWLIMRRPPVRPDYPQPSAE